jgi:hypothetical protein
MDGSGVHPTFPLVPLKKGVILEAMQGYTACQLKPAFFRPDQSQFPGVAAVTAAFPEGGGVVIFIFFPRGNPVKYTDPDGKYLGIKIQFDKLGSAITGKTVPPDGAGMLGPTPSINPYDAYNESLQNDRIDLKSGTFYRDAQRIARNELGKSTREAETWASEEQTRFESLLDIRDDIGRTEIDALMDDAKEEYTKKYDATRFVPSPNGRGFTLATEQQKKKAGDEAANIVIDNYIKSRIPSYPNQE